MGNPSTNPFVSRGGLKLAAALDAFNLDVTGFTCVDLGANVGGFTDCLLQRGASKVFAIDTGYGELAWKLRNDDRVEVMERTNGLHCDVKQTPVDLITIDMAWTKQSFAIPAALRWKPANIITLVKPHYEGAPQRKNRGILDEQQAQLVTGQTLEQMPSLGVEVINHIISPIRGGAGKGKKGNVEYLAHLTPLPPPEVGGDEIY